VQPLELQTQVGTEPLITVAVAVDRQVFLALHMAAQVVLADLALYS
jgi:hypothetical protein